MSNLADLEIFSRIVTSGSMSQAGRDLGLSPAVVSKRMKRLEERLGTRLLQRTTRQVALTEAGQGFYERVVGILASIDEAEAFVSRRSTAVHGTLRLSAPTSFGRLHVAPHLPKFLAQHPDIAIDIELSDGFVDIVGEGYDLAIRIADLDDSSLIARRLAPVHRVLCATPDYVRRRGRPERISDLNNHTLLAATSQDPWKLEGPEGEVSVRTHGRLRTNSSEVVREAMLTGLGIALRSTWDVGPDLLAGRLEVVMPDVHGSHRVAVHAVYPTRRFLPQKVRSFIDWLAGIYGPVPYWDAGLSIGLDRPAPEPRRLADNAA